MTRTFTVTVKDGCNLSTTKTVAFTMGLTCGTSLGHGDTATIGFWHNKNGQALINAQTPPTALANWLALNFLTSAGSHTLEPIIGRAKPISRRCRSFLQFFAVKGMNTDAQIMAGALASLVTGS